jgi:hypothetical protein
MDINIIKQYMSDVRKFYHSALPQLDMLAAHHNLQFDGSDMSQDNLASLRSEGAQIRREARLNNDLRDKLRNTTEYVHEQSKVQSQGLHRRFDHEGRALADRDAELDRIRTQSRQEITKRRQTEDEMSQVREDLRLATEENRAYRAQRQFNSTAQQDIDARQRTNVGENPNFQPQPQRENNSSQHTQGDVPLQNLHGSRQQDQYDPQHCQNQHNSVGRGNNSQPHYDRGGGSSSLPPGAANFGYQMLSVLSTAILGSRDSRILTY